MVLIDGLIAHYLLHNNAEDSTDSYDGVNNGTLTYSGEDVLYDGATGYIDLSAMPDTISDTMTFSFWINMNGNTYDWVWSHRDDDTTQYNIYIENLKISLQMATTAYSLVTNNSTGSIASNAMSHVVVVVDIPSGEAKIYIDKVLDSTHSFTMNNAFDSIKTLLHATKNSSDLYISGNDTKLANLRIYNTLKIQTDVDDLYNEGSVPAQPITSTANIIVTASAEVTLYVPESTANIAVTASADVEAVIAQIDIFSFAYSLQRAEIENTFKFVYSIEQPKTTTTIKRVNA